MIAELCHSCDVVAFTDEIYEHIVYAGEHIPLATLPGMRERTVAVNALSKTYSVTGWRVGWVIAPPHLTNGIRKVHDFLTVGAAAPLQAAGAVALGLPDDYYTALADGYRERRDVLVPALETAGFRTWQPDGAYYVMTDITGLDRCRRRDLRPPARRVAGRGRGAGLVVLLAAGARSLEGPLRLPEEARDAPRGRRSARAGHGLNSEPPGG